MSEASIGKRLEQAAKQSRKKERFLVTRMWLSTLMSLLNPDRLSIPENIGNNVYIGNNQVVTKNSITTVIQIDEFSLKTVVAITSDIINKTKDNYKGVIVDFTIKSKRRHVDLSSGGMESRLRQWERTLDNPASSKKSKERAARLIYTYQRVEEGNRLFNSEIYIKIRARDGRTSKGATQYVSEYLTKHKILHTVVKSDIKSHLNNFSIFTRRRIKQGKSFNVMSSRTLAETLPSTPGFNDLMGLYLGMLRENGFPYFIDFKKSAKGKNIYIIAPTGDGKTFLVINWCQDAIAMGYNLALMDIKGNEFSAMTDAYGGITLSLGADSTEFVNTFKWNVQNVKDGNYEAYAKRMKSISLEYLMILSKQGDNNSDARKMFDTLLTTVYLVLGASETNPNTWYRTQELHPFKVFEYINGFVDSEVISVFGDIATKGIENLKMFMHPEGTNSHIFRTEYDLSDIMNTRCLRYNFGGLSSEETHDSSIFKFKYLTMDIVNEEYARYKKDKGEWVFKVLEESQYVSDYVLDRYVKEVTLRRSQNQVTVMLGNSIMALKSRPNAQALLENLNLLAIGGINSDPRAYMIKQFGLEEYAKDLENLKSNPDYERYFLLVNRMSKKSVSGLITADVPADVVNSKLYKVVDIEGGDVA